jgi:hypothetical protein
MDSGESQNREWFHMDWYSWETCSTLEFVISDVQTWKSYQRWSYWSFIVIILYLNKTNILMEFFGHVFNL